MLILLTVELQIRQDGAKQLNIECFVDFEKCYTFAINLQQKNNIETATMDTCDVSQARTSHLIESFTPKQRAEFNNGITIQDYAREKGIRIL